MEQNPIVNLIEDLKKIASLLPILGYMHPRSEETPDFVVLYLAANSGLIELCLDGVYKDRTQEQRLEMCKSHRELHESVVHKDSHKLASSVLWSAKNCWKIMLEPHIDQDDIRALVRALEYAKYCVDPFIIRKVFMHPIDKYLPA